MTPQIVPGMIDRRDDEAVTREPHRRRRLREPRAAMAVREHDACNAPFIGAASTATVSDRVGQLGAAASSEAYVAWFEPSSSWSNGVSTAAASVGNHSCTVSVRERAASVSVVACVPTAHGPGISTDKIRCW